MSLLLLLGNQPGGSGGISGATNAQLAPLTGDSSGIVGGRSGATNAQLASLIGDSNGIVGVPPPDPVPSSVYTTRIVGSLYSSITGDKITSGDLLIRTKNFVPVGSQYSFIGGVIAPITKIVNVPPTGDLDFYLVAPNVDVTYIVEYDSDPDDTDTPLEFKQGYFKDEWVGMSNLAVTYAARALSDNPLFFIRLGDTSGLVATDSSANELDGAYDGDVTLGISGLVSDGTYAATFGGVSSQVTLPALGNPAPTRVTFSAFIKPTNAADTQAILFNQTSVSNFLGLANSRVRFSLFIDGVEYVLNGTTILQDNTTYHVAGSYDGDMMRIVINGVLDASLSITGSVLLGISPVFTIGRGANAAPNRFVGVLDEVALFGIGLSVSDLANHYEGRLVNTATQDISLLF